MSNSDLQYLSDTVLIEKIAVMDSDIIKQAGIADEIGLGSIGSFIKNFVKNTVKADEPGGMAGGVLELIMNGVIFKINPLFWILSKVVAHLGLDIYAIARGMVAKIKPLLESKGQVTSDEVSSIGREVVSQVAGPITAEASYDMLEHLRKLDASGELDKMYKTAFLESYALKRSTTSPNIPFFGQKGRPVLERIFGDLFRLRRTGKAKWLVGGLIVWTIKTALLGAGLMAGASLLGGLLGGKKKKDKEEEIPEPGKEIEPIDVPKTDEKQEPDKDKEEEITDPLLTPTSFGRTRFVNDEANVWIVPLMNRDIVDTLLYWASEIYPDLSGYEDIIVTTRSFNETAENLEDSYYRNKKEMPDELIMPRDYHSLKQVVDTFAKDAARKIRKI